MLSGGMGEVWSAAAYERLASRFRPVQDQLVELLDIAPGDRVLDLATGTGEIAFRAARRGANVAAIDLARPMVEKARQRAEEEGLEVLFEVADVEYLPFEDACFDVLVSNFGLIFAPDHANVAAEIARVTSTAGRLGFSAWKPNSKLGELYRRFTEEPIEGREAYEWGREDHVEDMLGEDFELEFEDGTLWLEAESGEEIWKLFSESAPPVISLLRRLDEEQGEFFHRAFVELYEGYRTKDGGIRAPRRYLLVLGRRK
jgi:ubiquinone/menaquinone biosynthesis C-methylase UbiE